jgi:transposase
MLTIGVDSHKRSLTAAAIDSAGREAGTLQVPSTPTGRNQLLEWVKALAPGEHQWGIEGSGMYGRPLAQQLARTGQRVYEVSGLATSRERRGGIGVHRQKTDTSDALAVARVTLRESARLPRIYPAGMAHRCKLLTEHRENLVLQRTKLMNQLHAQVALADSLQMPKIQCAQGRETLRVWAENGIASADPLLRVQGLIIQHLAALILVYDGMIHELAGEMSQLAQEAAPSLLELHGAGALTTAKILGEVGDIRRFPSRAKFASYCGVAPIEASSGERVRHRLNRRGNRQLNCALHTIAMTQRRWHPQARAYLDRKVAEGKTRKEALRCLKRHLANAVFQLLWRDVQVHQPVAAHAA